MSRKFTYKPKMSDVYLFTFRPSVSKCNSSAKNAISPGHMLPVGVIRKSFRHKFETYGGEGFPSEGDGFGLGLLGINKQ